MDLNLIKKLVKIVDTSEITDLEIEEEGLRVKIAKKIRTLQNSIAQSSCCIIASHVLQTANQPLSLRKKRKKQLKQESANIHEIKSPIVGTFYRAPAPDADPYVQVGDTISVRICSLYC